MLTISCRPGPQIFLQKHASSKGERLVSGNSMFFRMHRILDIYFVGGFGTVCMCLRHPVSRCKPSSDSPNPIVQVETKSINHPMHTSPEAEKLQLGVVQDRPLSEFVGSWGLGSCRCSGSTSASTRGRDQTPSLWTTPTRRCRSVPQDMVHMRYSRPSVLCSSGSMDARAFAMERIRAAVSRSGSYPQRQTLGLWLRCRSRLASSAGFCTCGASFQRARQRELHILSWPRLRSLRSALPADAERHILRRAEKDARQSWRCRQRRRIHLHRQAGDGREGTAGHRLQCTAPRLRTGTASDSDHSFVQRMNVVTC